MKVKDKRKEYTKYMNNTSSTTIMSRHCRYCGKVLERGGDEGFRQFVARRYCDAKCKGMGVARKVTASGEDVNFSKYIGDSTNQGREMADFYAGLMKRINRLEDDSEPLGMFRGVKVTPELVKTANDFLMNNFMGKPGQRAPAVERDDRPEDEKIKELKYLVERFGYVLVSKKEFGILNAKTEGCVTEKV